MPFAALIPVRAGIHNTLQYKPLDPAFAGMALFTWLLIPSESDLTPQTLELPGFSLTKRHST